MVPLLRLWTLLVFRHNSSNILVCRCAQFCVCREITGSRTCTLVNSMVPVMNNKQMWPLTQTCKTRKTRNIWFLYMLVSQVTETQVPLNADTCPLMWTGLKMLAYPASCFFVHGSYCPRYESIALPHWFFNWTIKCTLSLLLKLLLMVVHV